MAMMKIENIIDKVNIVNNFNQSSDVVRVRLTKEQALELCDKGIEVSLSQREVENKLIIFFYVAVKLEDLAKIALP